MLLAGSCWMWAAYGVTIVGFMLPAMKAEWQVSSSAMGLLAGIGMLGMLTGSILAGSLSDRFGRRRVLTFTMFYLGLMFLFSAFAWSNLVLSVLRFFTGIGLGAILPTAGTLVSEFSPTKQRGTLLVIMNGFWGLGGTLAAIIGYYLVLNFGWRPAMFFGCLSFVSGILVLILLPESLRFLLNKGKFEQASNEANRVQLNSFQTVANPSLDSPQVVVANGSANGVWSKQYARITFSLWVLWISLNFLYQGVFIWLPTLLATGSTSIQRSFLLTLFISLGQIPGTLIVAYLADRISRLKLVLISLGLLAASTIVFSFSADTIWVISFGLLIMVFNGMAWGLAHPFSSELYPTRMRGTATGLATGMGRLGGVAAPLIIGLIVQANGSMPVIFSTLAAAPLIALLVLTGMKQETTGRSLEEITES